jgi:hypothetical protein
MKKLAHILVLTVFAAACWLLWCILHLPSLVAHGQTLPAFTILCVGLRPVMIVFPILAAIYCVWILFRKTGPLPSWVGFFAATMSVLVLVTLPTLIATYLPLANAVNHLTSK